jgi:o-succinylbenzoate---CoA ligase
MALGSDLWREQCPAWEEGGSFLLLNPRLPDQWRRRVMAAEFPDLEDQVWLATSGSGGVLKLVALSRDALEASARAVNKHLGVLSSDIWLNPLPLFHVGGLGIVVRAGLAGSRCEVLQGAWEAGGYVGAAERCGATLSSLVPTQVHDLVRGGWRAPGRLRAAVVGGGVLAENLQAEAAALGWPLLPSYGLTEFASQVATARPAVPSRWLPLLDHAEARIDGEGVLELRGPSLLTGRMIFNEDGGVQWEDPKVGGWLCTGDRAELLGRELRVLGRADDVVKIRGELVDVAALERALQGRVKAGAVMVRSVPDARTGRALEVVTESEEAREQARAAQDVFPPYARPRDFVSGVIRRNAMGKPVRRAEG